MHGDSSITFDSVRYYQFLLMHFSRFYTEGRQATVAARLPFVRRALCNTNVLKTALKSAKKSGPVFEFGVFRGRTINFMAELLPEERIYGFDSFEGFPDDGRKDWKGDFSVEHIPEVRENVELVRGFFDQTLPAFLEAHPNLPPPRIVHIDCDIYSSTDNILQILRDRLDEGTILVFDELLHYAGFARNEFLAFFEFLEARKLSFRWCAVAGKLMPLADILERRSQGNLPARMAGMRTQGYHQYAAVTLEQRPAEYEEELSAFENQARLLTERFPFKHPGPLASPA